MWRQGLRKVDGQETGWSPGARRGDPKLTSMEGSMEGPRCSICSKEGVAMGRSKRSFACLVLAGICLFLAGSVTQSQAYVASFEDYVKSHFNAHGYFAQRFSVNTADPEEVPGDNSGQLSMMRSTLYTDVDYTPFSWLRLATIFEADLEYPTSYLRELDRMTSANLWDEYSRWDFREFYGDFQFGNRLMIRLGRQQVIWGDTDFFRGIDLVQGFDYRWRSFLEAENEYVRIPLIMANIMIQVPELNGNLQLLVRPGVDKDEWIGNRYDLYGGRWSSKPSKGVNFFDVMTYDLDHKEGDQNDPSYGVRWAGELFGIEYTLNYLHTFNEDPIVNSAFVPWKEAPKGAIGDFIYPMIDLVGFTANVDIDFLDVVARTECSYTWDKPFNVGRDFLGGALPGFGGIATKDVFRWMVNFDWNANFAPWLLGADRPGFFSAQVFDTWVLDYDKDKDDLVALAGYGAKLTTHTMYITVIFGWNYLLDRINPQIAWGIDPEDASQFIIPSLSFVYGDHWRLKLEYDKFFNNSGKSPGEIENKTRVFKLFEDNDQFYVRLMYQF